MRFLEGLAGCWCIYESPCRGHLFAAVWLIFLTGASIAVVAFDIWMAAAR